MKHQSKLSQQQQQTEHNATAHEARQQAGHEFASAEELLRFDAKNTIVPPEIAERLKESAGNLPQAPRRTWWRNLFGS